MPTLRYPCLVLDHDDTIVNSTATLHYPAFNAYMKQVRPDIQMTLNEYYSLNFDPGVIALFRDICGLSEKEMKEEENFWREYVKNRIPPIFPGVKEILHAHKEKGGLICVVSHSFSHYILRDYAAGGLPRPDLVYGWDMEPSLRKPHPHALYEIQKTFDLSLRDMLVVDDLKPGYDMAVSAGVPFAAAGWAIDAPDVEAFMREHCSAYFKTVKEWGDFLGLTPR